MLVAFTLVLVPPAPAAGQPSCGPASEEFPPSVPWQLRRLDLSAVWQLSRGAGVTVAVLDSGVSAVHPALTGKVQDGRDFGLPDQSGQCDEDGHGTAVAGIIAARDGTDVPFWGVAPDATVLPGRVLLDRRRSQDPGLPGQIAQAIRWAVDSGADVINLSLDTVPSQQLQDAVSYALAQDVVLVAAAGNVQEGEQVRPAYPAAFEGVIGVGGVGEDGQHVDSSVGGDYLDVAAPGDGIIGPAPRGSGYLAQGEGTSFAAAYVSGVVALVRAYHPDLPAAEVVRRVLATADNPPELRTDEIGFGVVNPYRAVTTILGTRDNPPVEPLVPAPVEPDPLGRERSLAGWVALAGAVVTVLLLLGPPLIRRGQQRRWRPARSAG